MKRTALLLTAALLLLNLLACKKQPDSPAEGPASTDGTAPEPTAEETVLDSIKPIGFGGEEFHFITYEEQSLVNHDPTQTGEIIGEVAFKRTEYCEQLHDLQLCQKVLINPIDRTYDAIRQNHMGGGTDIHLAIPHPSEGLAATLMEGYCTDILSLGTPDFEGPWYHQSQLENYRNNGKLYLIASDFTVTCEPYWGLIYNKALYTALGGQTDLYGTVRDGDWTLDCFLEELKSLNATGKQEDGSHGTYSIVWNRGAGERPLMFACDIPTVERNAENQYSLSINQPSVKEKIDRLVGVMSEIAFELPTAYYTDRTYFYKDLPSSEVLSLFLSGKTVFEPWDVGSLYNLLRTRNFEIGYLPLPKYDSMQTDYLTTCQAGMTLIPSVLPVEVQEQSAAVLETLARYSYLYARPAYFETVIGGRLSENQDDYDMLVLINQSRYYDIINAFDGGSVIRNLLYQVAIVNRSHSCSVYLKQKAPIMNMVVSEINKIQ